MERCKGSGQSVMNFFGHVNCPMCGKYYYRPLPKYPIMVGVPPMMITTWHDQPISFLIPVHNK